MKIKRLLVGLTIGLVLAQLLLVLLSWLLSAMMVDGVRSLLSSEGIRWFFGNFASVLASPLLVWLLLLAMAGGVFWRSGLLSKPRTYSEKTALRMAVFTLLLYLMVVAALTVVPHAVLLSATGRLLSSPFSRAAVPIVAFGLLLVSVVYGRMSGRFTSATDIFDAMSAGIARCAPLFIVYVVLMQLYASVLFVF